MDKLALPWPEADFEAGYSRSAPVTLDSSQGNGGIFAEVVKILTLWWVEHMQLPRALYILTQ